MNNLKDRKDNFVYKTVIKQEKSNRGQLVGIVRPSKNGKYFLVKVYSEKYWNYEIEKLSPKCYFKNGELKARFIYGKRINIVASSVGGYEFKKGVTQ
jgi:hypothetical protein